VLPTQLLIVFGPRNDASTISVFCCAVNLRYFLVSLNTCSSVLERPILDSEPDETTTRYAGISPSNHNRGSANTTSGSTPPASRARSKSVGELAIAARPAAGLTGQREAVACTSEATAAASVRLRMVPISAIVPIKGWNPRMAFDDAS
jgi:hypothetical protein